MSRDRYVEVEVDEVVKETEQAFLLRIEGDEVWIPKSQINRPDEVAEGEAEFPLEITHWIADQKGLI